MDRIRTAAVISAVTGLAALAWLPSAAWAQAAADQAATGTSQQAQNSDDSNTLQEVVVTAEKRTTDVQTTPISIVAVSGGTLEEQNQTRISDLQLTTPSFTAFNINGEYSAPNIRGIGNNQFNATNTPGVTVTKDGLYLEGIHDLGDPFYDIQDIEVLRGPQGDFADFASDGGAVQITTVNPNFKPNLNGYVEAQIGNYSDERIDAAFNDALSDTFAVRLAVNEEKMHSFYRDVTSIVTAGSAKPIQDPGQTDNKNFRLGMLWKPADNFQALLKIEFNSLDDYGAAAEPEQTPYTLPASVVSVGCPNGLSTTGLTPAGPGGQCYSTYYAFSSHVPFALNYNSPVPGILPAEDVPLTSWRDSLTLTGTLPNGVQIKSETGFQQTQWDTVTGNTCDCDFTSATGTQGAGSTYQYIPNDDYYSQEIDVLSPSTGKFTWIAGAIWFGRWSVTTGDSVTSTPPYTVAQPEFSVSDTLTVARTEGVFAHMTYQFLPTLQLEAGARGNFDNGYGRGPIDQVEKSTYTAPCTQQPARLPGYGCVDLATNGAFRDETPTGKVTLNWTPAQGQFIYAFYARGYKPGGFLAGNPNPFLNEYVNDYELGWKTTALNGHLQNSLGGYWMVYQGMQQSVYSTATGTSTTGNLGSSTLKGIEESLTLREGGFGLELDGDYEKSALGALTQPASYALPPAAANAGQCTGPGGTVKGAGQSVCFNYNPYLLNLSGEEQPYAPETSATLTLDYRFTLFGGTLDPKVQFNYTAKQYAGIFDIPYYELGAHKLLNAYITYDKGAWDSELFMTNATNQIYLASTGGTVTYGNPMQIGVRFRRDF